MHVYNQFRLAEGKYIAYSEFRNSESSSESFLTRAIYPYMYVTEM